MNTETNKLTSRKFQEYHDKGDLDAMIAVMSPDMVATANGSPMHLDRRDAEGDKHILRQVEPGRGNIRHDRHPQWILTVPRWHSDAVGGRSNHQSPSLCKCDILCYRGRNGLALAESMEKVFCIGLNRTGTKSFARAMRVLGYRSIRWSPRAAMLYLSGRIDEVYGITDQYDSFDDWPWPLMARDLLLRFPKAKFVLTYRTSEKVWLDSIKRHAIKAPGGSRLRERIFGHANPHGNEEAYVAFYIGFYDRILAISDELHCHDRILSVCWEAGDGWSELCSFLGKPRPNVEFPHINSSSGKSLHRRPKR